MRVLGAYEDTVYPQHELPPEPVLVEGSSLVLSQGHLPDDALLTELSSSFAGEVVGIGDVLAPRTAEEAVLEALKAASAL